MYLILQPHSNTNPSIMFRVVLDENWFRFIDGYTTSYASIPFASYEAAREYCDHMNYTPDVD